MCSLSSPLDSTTTPRSAGAEDHPLNRGGRSLSTRLCLAMPHITSDGGRELGSVSRRVCPVLSSSEPLCHYLVAQSAGVASVPCACRRVVCFAVSFRTGHGPPEPRARVGRAAERAGAVRAMAHGCTGCLRWSCVCAVFAYSTEYVRRRLRALRALYFEPTVTNRDIGLSRYSERQPPLLRVWSCSSLTPYP